MNVRDSSASDAASVQCLHVLMLQVGGCEAAQWRPPAVHGGPGREAGEAGAAGQQEHERDQ